MKATQTPLKGTLTYAYDANGNRLSKTLNGGITETYAYGLGDRLLSISGPWRSRSYAYDAVGRAHAVGGPLIVVASFVKAAFAWQAAIDTLNDALNDDE